MKFIFYFKFLFDAVIALESPWEIQKKKAENFDLIILKFSIYICEIIYRIPRAFV